MTAKVFVDTNVLVYCRDASEPDETGAGPGVDGGAVGKANRAAQFPGAPGILRDRRPPSLDLGLTPEEARLDVQAPSGLEADCSRMARLLEEAWRLQDRYRFSWWDALIAAAAQVSDCRYLLSEDFQEGMELGDLKVVNPFLNRPEDF